MHLKEKKIWVSRQKEHIREIKLNYELFIHLHESSILKTDIIDYLETLGKETRCLGDSNLPENKNLNTLIINLKQYSEF